MWGVVDTPDNSQELLDWYSLSHVIHGLGFYGILHLVARRWPLSVRALVATLVEVGWEVVENTPFIIDRYREATISLDYFGDSVVNSVSDVLAMLFGFSLARVLPVWASVVLAIALEALAAYLIRDGLILNIIMLVHPVDAIRAWQAGGLAREWRASFRSAIRRTNASPPTGTCASATSSGAKGCSSPRARWC